MHFFVEKLCAAPWWKHSVRFNCAFLLIWKMKTWSVSSLISFEMNYLEHFYIFWTAGDMMFILLFLNYRWKIFTLLGFWASCWKQKYCRFFASSMGRYENVISVSISLSFLIVWPNTFWDCIHVSRYTRLVFLYSSVVINLQELVMYVVILV